jgi:hypothetical protein
MLVRDLMMVCVVRASAGASLRCTAGMQAGLYGVQPPLARFDDSVCSASLPQGPAAGVQQACKLACMACNLPLRGLTLMIVCVVRL